MVQKPKSVTIKRPVQLTMEDGQSLFVQSYDLSPSELVLKCSEQTALKINPDGTNINEAKSNVVRAAFVLPMNDKEVKVEVFCKIQYVAMLPASEDNDCVVGLGFQKFSGEAIRYVGSFIQQELGEDPAINY